MKPTATPILEARNTRKAFPGVQALAGVDFSLFPGEVHVLLGENGAGKSTLVKILSGRYRPDEGEVRLNGEPVAFDSPNDALSEGIATVYQEFNLVPYMTVAENIFLGHEPRRYRFLDRRKRNREAVELMHRVGIELDPDVPLRLLGVAQLQMVEIIKALAIPDFRVLIMDEPTAALSRHEIATLFAVIRRLRDRGVGIIYISHRLEEIRQIGDRVSVFRDGERVTTQDAQSVGVESLIEWMVGRPVSQLYPPRQSKVGEPALVIEGLEREDGRVRGVDLMVRRGEILGLFGLVGAGRTETLRALFGADKKRAKRIELSGERVALSKPREAFRRGIGLAPEDRKQHGIVPHMSVADNICLASLQESEVGPLLSPRRVKSRAQQLVKSLRIATPSVETPIRSLSGGNQQKCMIGRLLSADSDILLLDEPTRGIDVGARAEIYRLLNELTAQGKAIILASSDLPEVMGVSDRILIFQRGVITGELQREDFTEQAIMRGAVPERYEEELEDVVVEG